MRNYLVCEHIANLVRDGFVCGHYPDWHIEYSGIEKQDISECSLDYIAKYIRDGFVQGEIFDEVKSGWWELFLSRNP
jgi:hypothetical protein